MQRICPPRIVLALAALLGIGCDGGSKDPVPPPPAEVAGAPTAHGASVAVPVGVPVRLDGRFPSGEWSSAATLPLGDGGAQLRVQQLRGSLLLAFEATTPWTPRSRLLLLFSPTAERGVRATGAVRADYEPREHNRPHLLVTRATANGEEPVVRAGVARAHVDLPRPAVEILLRLPELGVDPASPGELRFAAAWIHEPGVPPDTWPKGLHVAAQAGGAARDLADGSRWGRLAGWVDVDGPGAVSATSWDALVAEDDELLRRGQTLHSTALLLGEEEEWPKRDAETVPEVDGALRWISEREPLHAADLVAAATVYRCLNRRTEALAMLEAAALDPAWRRSQLVLYQRARALESLERFPEAAEVWDEIAAMVPEASRGSYLATAARARRNAELVEAERKAREEDDAAGDLPLVLLETSRGAIVLQLFRRDVPASVDHFLSLVERAPGSGGGGEGGGGAGTYDGTLFHRVLGDKLVQGGDPASREKGCDAGGRGDPVASIPVEKNARHGFWRGAVGFARGISPENANQFFVLTGPRPVLGDQGYTCFGRVLTGMDVLDRIEQCDVLRRATVLRR
jgi:cyclophilin family peptidyl-prolyl cis-trans isomerase